MSIYGDIIQEKHIFNEEDIYYNKDKFDSGEINLGFITGHSGSGKSTMAQKLADKDSNIEYYQLDDVMYNKYEFTMEQLKEYGDLIYSFFKGLGKKYYYTEEEAKEGKVKPIEGDYDLQLTKDFVEYSIKYTKSHKNTKYVIEGIGLAMYIEPSILKEFAVYIKGTSAITSTFRAAKRDAKEFYPDNKKKQAKAFVKRMMEFDRLKLEKNLKKYISIIMNFIKIQ